MSKRPINERVQETLDLTIQNLQQEVEDRVDDEFTGLVRMCESPIEELFLAAFVQYTAEGVDYAISPQMKIGSFRVDFCVGYLEGYRHGVRVVVECDGHDFHEKTKEQAERDKRRDREIVAKGYPVMRFTGRELWRDPHACVEEVIDYTQDVVDLRQRGERAQRQAERERVEVEVTEPGDA